MNLSEKYIEKIEIIKEEIAVLIKELAYSNNEIANLRKNPLVIHYCELMCLAEDTKENFLKNLACYNKFVRENYPNYSVEVEGLNPKKIKELNLIKNEENKLKEEFLKTTAELKILMCQPEIITFEKFLSTINNLQQTIAMKKSWITSIIRENCSHPLFVMNGDTRSYSSASDVECPSCGVVKREGLVSDRYVLDLKTFGISRVDFNEIYHDYCDELLVTDTFLRGDIEYLKKLISREVDGKRKVLQNKNR